MTKERRTRMCFIRVSLWRQLNQVPNAALSEAISKAVLFMYEKVRCARRFQARGHYSSRSKAIGGRKWLGVSGT